MSPRDEYIEKMKTQLDELNKGIEKLEEKARVAEVQLIAAYQSEMKVVRMQSQMAIGKFDEIRASGENTWEKLKVEMEKAHHALVRSFHNFNSKE